jgi:hypothetical protein
MKGSLDLFLVLPGATEMTGSSKADFDDMAAPGFQAKGFEKGGDVMKPGQRNLELLGNIPECFWWQVVFKSLYILQDAYHGIVSICVFFEYEIDLFKRHSALRDKLN